MISIDNWSIDEWCQQQIPTSWDDIVHDTSMDFIQLLNLTFLHPFCNIETRPNPYNIPNIPSQGPLMNYDHLETWYDVLVTIVAMSIPSLAAMTELWLRLLSALIAPISVLYLTYIELFYHPNIKHVNDKGRKLFVVSFICIMSVANSAVLFTDTLYIMEFGPMLGGTLLGLSSIVCWKICTKYGLYRTGICIIGILCLVFVLVYDYQDGTIKFGDPNQLVLIDEGLYYNSKD
jgi:hypothetical protein